MIPSFNAVIYNGLCEMILLHDMGCDGNTKKQQVADLETSH